MFWLSFDPRVPALYIVDADCIIATKKNHRDMVQSRVRLNIVARDYNAKHRKWMQLDRQEINKL